MAGHLNRPTETPDRAVATTNARYIPSTKTMFVLAVR
jgi:hypothetical protein